MLDREEVDLALTEALWKFGLAEYVEALLDTLDSGGAFGGGHDRP